MPGKKKIGEIYKIFDLFDHRRTGKCGGHHPIFQNGPDRQQNVFDLRCQ